MVDTRGRTGEQGIQGERGERGPARKRAVIGYVILALATVAGFYATYNNEKAIERARIERIGQLNTINQFQCAALQNLYTSIRTSITESDRRLDQLDYYRTHPDELAAQHAANVEQLNRYNLPPCPDKIMLAAQ